MSNSGQIMTEYVIMLAIGLTLSLALFFLVRAISEFGDRSAEQIAMDVP